MEPSEIIGVHQRSLHTLGFNKRETIMDLGGHCVTVRNRETENVHFQNIPDFEQDEPKKKKKDAQEHLCK